MNKSYWFGLVGCVVLLFLICFGPSLAPHTMDEFVLFQKVTLQDGSTKMVTAPFPPSDNNPLGTDRTGRDMLSILLYGARITVTFAVGVAVFRLLVGLPLAYLGSIFPRTVGWLNEKLSTAFTTVPSVLIVMLLSTIFNITDALTPTQKIYAMAGVVAIVGLFPTSYVIQTKMSGILQSPFMEGQHAIGSGKWRILRKHIMPHLSTYTMVLFVSEIAQTLWLVGQLGVLYVFLGGAVSPDEPTTMKVPQEWAGRIGSSYGEFKANPMAVLYPVFALSFAILSFNLLAEGLRKRHERKWGIGA